METPIHQVHLVLDMLIEENAFSKWVVVVYLNGVRCEGACFYTEDKIEAVNTLGLIARAYKFVGFAVTIKQ